MSKAAKQSIFILILLIVGVLGFAGYTLFEKQKVEDAKVLVEEELEQTEMREAKQMKQVKELGKEVETLKAEKTELEQSLVAANKKSTDLQAQVEKVSQDRDKWKTRIDVITRERDLLTQKIATLNKSIGDTRKQLDQQLKFVKNLHNQKSTSNVEAEAAASQKATSASKSRLPTNIPPASDELYWARLLAEKAALEVQIEQMDEKLAQSSIEIVELKQQNEAIKLELSTLRSQSDELAQDIKYKGDMINNLSLELARTKNDKKYIADRMTKMQAENKSMRADMKRLVTAKSSLQKSIVRLTQDKNKVERELGSAESLIQSKIDEIWEIKDSLDRSFKETANLIPSTSNQVDLPPIMIRPNVVEAKTISIDESEPGYFGKVVSVNEDNNFVIIDIGEATGIQLGEDVSVYRDSKYVARLEVIQVRKDISAADIKDQWSKIKIGDTVR